MLYASHIFISPAVIAGNQDSFSPLLHVWLCLCSSCFVNEVICLSNHILPPLPPVLLSDKHISSGICLSCALLPSPPFVFTLLLPPALAPCPLTFSPLFSFSAHSLFPLQGNATPADAPCVWGSEERSARKICKQNSGRAAAADGDKKNKTLLGILKSTAAW